MQRYCAVLVFVGIFLFGAVGSVTADTASTPIGYKDPALSGLLSFMYPGAGQAYNGQYLKAVGVFVETAVGYGLIASALDGDDDSDDFIAEGKGGRFALGVTLVTLGYGGGIIEAVLTSKEINARLMRQAAFKIEGTPSGYGAMLSYRF